MISFSCVFAGVLIFARSLRLALACMCVVMSIVFSLLFYMLVILQWSLGAIEVLSLIIFIGFAVDYALHLAQKYMSCHVNQVVVEADEGIDSRDLGEQADDDEVDSEIQRGANVAILPEAVHRAPPSDAPP